MVAPWLRMTDWRISFQDITGPGPGKQSSIKIDRLRVLVLAAMPVD
jgi:hypothetical protein